MIKDLFNICPLIVWSGPKQQRRTHRPVGGWNILLRYFASQAMFQWLLRCHQNQEGSLTLDRCNHFEPPNCVLRGRRRRLHRDCKPPTRCTFLYYNSLTYDWWSLIIYLPTSNQVLEHFYAIILCYMNDDDHVIANLQPGTGSAGTLNTNGIHDQQSSSSSSWSHTWNPLASFPCISLLHHLN